MKYKLVKLGQFSGIKSSVYSIVENDEDETYLDKFVKEHHNSFKDEIIDILKRLRAIGRVTGARLQFFKEFEGHPGDGVCALYDEPESNLRLYCIRYGTLIVIVGNGGPKPKNISALQENDKLKEENYFLRWLSTEITSRIKEREIKYINNHLDFFGNLEFQDDERS